MGGGERIANLYSPAKKLKFTKELSSGESGSGYLAGPNGETADYLGRNNRLGGTRIVFKSWEVGKYSEEHICWIEIEIAVILPHLTVKVS